MHGYAGRILHVDLSTGALDIEELAMQLSEEPRALLRELAISTERIEEEVTHILNTGPTEEEPEEEPTASGEGEAVVEDAPPDEEHSGGKAALQQTIADMQAKAESDPPKHQRKAAPKEQPDLIEDARSDDQKANDDDMETPLY